MFTFVEKDANLKRSITDCDNSSQPDTLSPTSRVIDLGPETVYLVYNCFYMKDICQNYLNFRASVRGMNTHPISGIDSLTFGYDFHKATGKNSRPSKRRIQSCPSSWKNSHSCPETNQLPVMRHDGQWFTNRLEPFTSINEIQNKRDLQGNVLEYSKVRYTCDEFPPATWVEGGNGVFGSNRGETRCAAMRCGKGANGVPIKSEQDCTLF